MSTYTINMAQGIRVVQVGALDGKGVGTLPLAFNLAKRAAGWGEGGTGLQRVDADVETSILHAFRGLPSRPPRE